MDESLPLRAVTVMFDWECWALWVNERNSYRNVDPHAFGLSADLAQALDEWTAEAQATFVACDPIASGFREAAMQLAWGEQGAALAGRLQRELGNRATGEYFDEVAEARTRPDSCPADEQGRDFRAPTSETTKASGLPRLSRWSGRQESNLRHSAPKADALPG